MLRIFAQRHHAVNTTVTS